jgi:phage gp36-like protein
LDAKTDLTTAAQNKVNLQLARVEGLLAAQRTQELEEATWEERRAASDGLQSALNTALTDAEADVTTYAETLTKRSYLF